MNAYALLSLIGLLAPVPEPSPLTPEEAVAVVMELQHSVASFAGNLAGLEPDGVNDMKLFTVVQRRRLVGLLTLLRSVERDFSSVPSRISREALLEGSRELRAKLEKAMGQLKGVEDKATAVDVYRTVGRTLLESPSFQKFYRQQPDFEKPTVGESTIVLP